MSNTRNTNPEQPRPEASDSDAPADHHAGPPGPIAPGPNSLDPTDPEREPVPAQHRRQLAHELNNLLDGSLRNLSLALAELRGHGAADAADPSSGPATGPSSGSSDEESATTSAADPIPEETARRLQTANRSMQQMAELLRRWMATDDDAPPQPDRRASWGTLDEAITNARQQIDPLLAARDIELSVDLPDTLANQPAGAIQQVISNALRNAVEAVDRDGRIELTCERAGEDVLLRVRDDGVGFSPDLAWDGDGLPQPGATTKPGGHGMGLMISRRIAESMGGSLRLDPAEGGGAVLSLRWPAARS